MNTCVFNTKTFKAVQQLSWWQVLLALWQLSPVDINTDCCSDCAYQMAMTTSHSNDSKWNFQQLSIPVIRTQSTYPKSYKEDAQQDGYQWSQQTYKQYEQKVGRRITARSFIYIVRWTDKGNSTVTCWHSNILSDIRKCAVCTGRTLHIAMKNQLLAAFLANPTATPTYFFFQLWFARGNLSPPRASIFCTIPAWQTKLQIQKKNIYQQKEVK